MLIVCPNCATPYQLDASEIGEHGRSVRCVRCTTVWFAEPPSDEAVNAFRAEFGSEPPAPLEASTEAVAAGDGAHESIAAAEQPADPPPLAELTNSDPPADPAAASETAPNEPAAPVALSDIPIPVTDAPRLAPEARPAIDNSAHDIESAAIRRRAQRPAQKRRAMPRLRLPVVIAVFAILCTALLMWRKDAVRHMPQLASFYASIGLPVNLRGLTFTDLKIGRESHDGVPVLVVEGVIANGVGTAVEVPRLRFALRNAAGAEIYSWTAVPTQSALEPAEKLPFRSRLASPPDDGHDVQVRFFTRRDAVAGLP